MSQPAAHQLGRRHPARPARSRPAQTTDMLCTHHGVYRLAALARPATLLRLAAQPGRVSVPSVATAIRSAPGLRSGLHQLGMRGPPAAARAGPARKALSGLRARQGWRRWLSGGTAPAPAPAPSVIQKINAFMRRTPLFSGVAVATFKTGLADVLMQVPVTTNPDSTAMFLSPCSSLVSVFCSFWAGAEPKAPVSPHPGRGSALSPRI